ncbi:MAG: sulfatase, partial [Puniceicoccales bacterium]
RRDHCGPYHQGRKLSELGDQQPDWVVPTPNMDRLAARGTVFDNCWCGSSPCMPARRDLYTGRFEFLERGWGPLEDTDVDLPRCISGPPNESMAEMDRHVSYLVTDHFHLWEQGSGNYHMGFTGFDFIRGMEADAYITDPIPFPMPSEMYRNSKFERHYRNVEAIRRRSDGSLDEGKWFARQTFDTASSWLDGNAERKDFFLHIDSFSPHEPWDPPERLVKLFDERGYDVPEYFPSLPYEEAAKSGLNDDQVRHSQALYAASVVHVDECLGKLMEVLDRRQLWDDTLVIFTTDHGTYNGSRGLLGKLQTHQFDPVAHIPLIVAHPTLAHGERRAQLAQLVDLYASSLDGLGIDLPEDRHGRSLLPLLEDSEEPGREYALAGIFGMSVTITDGRWVLHQQPVDGNRPLRWYGHQVPKFFPYDVGPFQEGGWREVDHEPYPGETWLSDREADPNELKNSAGEHPEELRRMQALLKQALLELNAPKEQAVRLGLA